jgi:hypothetical protein
MAATSLAVNCLPNQVLIYPKAASSKKTHLSVAAWDQIITAITSLMEAARDIKSGRQINFGKPLTPYSIFKSSS